MATFTTRRLHRHVLRWFALVGMCLLLEGVDSFSPVSQSRNSYSPQRARCRLASTKPKEATSVEGGIDETVLQELNNCKSGTRARNVLQKALNKENTRYASITIPPGASDRGISDGDLAIQTKIRNNKYSIMELIELSGDRDADRASLAVLSIFVGSTASALVANQSLPGPEILRFVVVWLFSFAPLIFVGYGIATPDKLQALLVGIQRSIFPMYRKRMLQHEAGHFLMGHLLGLPIQGYAANAVKSAVEFYPLNDPDVGRDRASSLGFDGSTSRPEEDNVATTSSDAAFFGKGGSGSDLVETQSVFRNAKNYTANPFLKLPSQNEPSESWPYRGFDHATIDKLAVVSVAGVCAEILAFGNAEGGYADISQLRQIFNSAEPALDERDAQNRIRFALGYTMSQLRQNLGALDALGAVMERDGSVAECVLAIESCTNPSGQDGIMGDYEQRRKESFRPEGIGALERLLLGGGKNADVEEDRLVEGRGGGYRKEGFQITGDDPFYIALGVAFSFLVWASSGGLSLH